jgi:hypothetical protein
MKKPVDINALARKATKGRVKLLHAMPYLGCMVYVLEFDKEIFTYHAIINNQMYFSFIEGQLPVGKKRFTTEQIKNYVGLALASAHATIETVLGKNKKSEQALGETIIKAGEAAFGDGKAVN